MERKICCVCEKPIEGEVHKMGNRPYDADCYAKVMRNRQGLWWANWIGVGALVVFVILMALIFKGRAGPQGAGLVVVGVILALVPAFIWLAFFYLQDIRRTVLFVNNSFHPLPQINYGFSFL